MLLTLAITAAAFLFAAGYLANPVNRENATRRFIAGARMSAPIINAISWYVLGMAALFAAASVVLVVAAVFHWETVASIALMGIGAVLGGSALVAHGFTRTLQGAVSGVESEMRNLHPTTLHPDRLPADTSPALAASVNKLYEALVGFLSPEQVLAILTTAPRMALATVHGITGAVNNLARYTVDASLWIMILGFGVLFLPDSATVAQAVVAVLGLILIFVINAHKNWTTDQPWKTAKFWIRTAVYTSISSIVLGVFKAAVPEFSIATRVFAESKRESVARQYFGGRYDQHPLITTKVMPAHYSTPDGKIGQEFTYYPNQHVWRVPGAPIRTMPSGLVYYLCMRPLKNAPDFPDQTAFVLVPRDGTKPAN